MNTSPEKVEKNEGAESPRAIARRALLRRGAKLAYIVPAVLTAMHVIPANNAIASPG